MLLDRYESQGLLYNVNFKEATSRAGLWAYRGDLAIVEGEIADAQGRRKPPVVGLLGAVLLADEKLKLLAGWLDAMAHVPRLLEKYQADFAPELRAVLYVVNLVKPVQVDIDGAPFVFIPMTDGMVWNELVDELALEKSDFKGQSAADKVLTVYEAFKEYAPKYETVTFEAALALTNSAQRASRGPV